MSNSKIVFLVNKNDKHGIANILSDFFSGLENGLTQNNWDVSWLNDEIKAGTKLTLGFNVAGLYSWKSILDSGCCHIMWTVDSSFYHNFFTIKEYLKHPNFHLFLCSKTDIEPLNYFFPEFKNYHDMPIATDPYSYQYENQEKDLDIVYFASLQNPEGIIAGVKQKLPPNVFEIFMGMFNYLKTNPYVSIWELYHGTFLENESFDDDEKAEHAINFHYFYRNLTYLVSYTQRIQLAKSMEDVGIKIWGNDEWLKHISGKNEYMGFANLQEAVPIFARSKVSINLQPLQILEGMAERVFNATKLNNAVLCDPAPGIKNSFGESLTYFDVKNFTNIKQKALTLIKNKDLREYKIQKAKEIILNDHTWLSRAESMSAMMLENSLERV